jgi:hypothetical protein
MTLPDSESPPIPPAPPTPPADKPENFSQRVAVWLALAGSVVAGIVALSGQMVTIKETFAKFFGGSDGTPTEMSLRDLRIELRSPTVVGAELSTPYIEFVIEKKGTGAARNCYGQMHVDGVTVPLMDEVADMLTPFVVDAGSIQRRHIYRFQSQIIERDGSFRVNCDTVVTLWNNFHVPADPKGRDRM